MSQDPQNDGIALGIILAKYQQLPQFSELLLKRADQLGMDSESPFHIACYTGNKQEVLAMLTSGVNLNVRGDIGNTPLHDAALGGRTEIAKLLLSAGANKSLKNDYGDTPYDIAERNNYAELIILLKLPA